MSEDLWKAKELDDMAISFWRTLSRGLFVAGRWFCIMMLNRVALATSTESISPSETFIYLSHNLPVAAAYFLIFLINRVRNLVVLSTKRRQIFGIVVLA